MTPSRILHVVDADPLPRVDLMRRLAGAGYEVRTFASLGEYVRGRAERPSCLLAGLSGRDREMLAIGHAGRADEAPSATVFVARDADIALAVSAMKTGAFDLVTWPIETAVLQEVVERAAAASEAWLAAHSLRNRAQALLGRLTPRERAIFAHILRGERNKQIAAALGSREATVKVHRSRLMRKLESRTLAELLHLGRELEGSLTADDAEPPPAPPKTRPTVATKPALAGAAILSAHAQQRRVDGQRVSTWAGLYLR